MKKNLVPGTAVALVACIVFSSCASAPKNGASAASDSVAASPPVSARPEWTAMERRTVELSFIALAGFWHTDPAQVSKTVTELLGRMLPDQELVWGPAVHQPLPDFIGQTAKLSDALVFICRDRATGEYSVVFRGTNTISAIEWIYQDFMVQKQVPWREIRPGSAPEDALVSEGTETAIQMRLELSPAEGSAGAGVSLAEAFVAMVERSKAPCVAHFTGHSLGGLLAPAMALWLVDYLGSCRPELAAKLAVDVYGYAAPTAGNKAFADYLAARVPNQRRYASDLDIATLAWDEATMGALPYLYQPGIAMDALTRPLYDIGMSLAKGRGYTQPVGRIAVPSKIVPTRGDSYFLEAAYQHSIPYLDILLPERKAVIMREVINPLTERTVVKGFRPVEFEELYSPES
jgi:hypothetical protein